MMTSEQHESLATERTRDALIAAAGIGAWLLVTTIAEKLLGLFSLAWSYGASPGMYDAGLVPSYWWDILTRLVVFVLPVTVGFFLAWRFVVPITGTLSLAGVIRHSVAATALAAALYFVAKVLEGFVTFTSMAGSLFGDSFPGLDYQGPGPLGILGDLQGAIVALLSLLPLGVLAGILLQGWLRSGRRTRRIDV